MRDFHLFPIFENFEVVEGQSPHRVPTSVRNVDLDTDQGHIHRGEEHSQRLIVFLCHSPRGRHGHSHENADRPT